MGRVNEGFSFSDKELLDFLSDIEQEDQEVVESDFTDSQDLTDLIEKSKVTKEDKAIEYANNYKARVRAINEMAFKQKIVDLKDYISKEHGQIIVKSLISKFDSLIERWTNYAVNRCNKLLSAKIPLSLRTAYKTYPQAFIKVPGFIYVVPVAAGHQPFLYIELDLPYYFEQGTESQVIQELGLKYSSKINSAIFKIEEYKAKKNEAEALYAIKIAKLPRGSYLELLKNYPLWFELLIKTLTNECSVISK